MSHARATAVIGGVLILTLASWFAGPVSAGTQDVINSSHNLSASGPGAVKSSQTQICIFCHAPHGVQPDLKPLWNHAMPTQSYNSYASSTMKATAAAPSPASKQCLSCHDGTIALGQTIANGLITTSGSLSAAKNLGTDLRGDHPISFTLVNNGELSTNLFLTPPTTADPAVKLRNGNVECVTCHDPHTPNLDAIAGMFLVRSNSSGALCLACHDPSRPQPSGLNGWTGGAHRTAGNSTPAGALFGVYGNVAANACLNCHQSHNAASGSSPRLLRNAEEAACSQCHSGTNLSPVIANITGEFSKTYSHPVTTISGLHDAAENAFPLNANRHSECADCHNSHAASNVGGSTVPPALQSSLLGASGVDQATGITALRPATNEYQICFKCHANSTNKPQSGVGYAVYGRTPVRQTFSAVADPHNVRLDFNTTLERHPVTQPRYLAAAAVPSLRATMVKLDGSAGRSLGTGSYIYCADCHSNDQARVSAGTGPNGTHGSIYPHLFERRYEVETPPSGGVSYTAGTTGTYALCDKCHDIANSILQDRSFKLHRTHISGVRTACSTCHSAHGIQGGSTTNNKSLVNFDTAIVKPSSSGSFYFQSNGTFTGVCYLSCHGQNHNGYSY
ncbi:MAG: cytochrome c3 family protein [Acidobacteriia bacterium]|nr:cytochrome c3 family protein [Terriglobia bacterium]